jgi:hypothetical protein
MVGGTYLPYVLPQWLYHASRYTVDVSVELDYRRRRVPGDAYPELANNGEIRLMLITRAQKLREITGLRVTNTCIHRS